MKNEKIDSISETKSCIERLSEYEFDELVHDENDFGRKYTAQNLPENFNLKWFENTDMYEFGRQILNEKNGSVTSYGAVSGRGQSLYSVMDIQPEQTNSEEPDEDESEEMEVCLS